MCQLAVHTCSHFSASSPCWELGQQPFYLPLGPSSASLTSGQVGLVMLTKDTSFSCRTTASSTSSVLEAIRDWYSHMLVGSTLSLLSTSHTHSFPNCLPCRLWAPAQGVKMTTLQRLLNPLPQLLSQTSGCASLIEPLYIWDTFPVLYFSFNWGRVA